MAGTGSGIAWEDFDDESIFNKYFKKAHDAQSQNFILEFSGKSAQCVFNLGEEDISTLLSQRKSQVDAGEATQTRWINIWMPEGQKGTIDLLARHYGFSPRLKSSMSCAPNKPVAVGRGSMHIRRTVHQVLQGVPKKGKEEKEAETITLASTDGDIEKNQTMDSAPSASSLDINHYRIVDEVWHFASVDWGFRFTCIGFNSLYQTSNKVGDEDQQKRDKPAGKRAWTWLILGHDNTVISVHENAFPGPDEPNSKELVSIRHNLINVFKQLSKAKVKEQNDNPILTVNIRPGLHDHEGDEAQVSDSAVPSLLFYYLFDDWLTSYALVARREHQYSKHLERIRDQMFKSPDLDNARQLHHVGRQLAVLKRIYESYTMIIGRLLKGPQARTATAEELLKIAQRSAETTQGLAESANLDDDVSNYGVTVSTAAAVRFARLRDRINLYAMSEIQDCLEEKEALVMLNFNLVALKESSFVERLTRITILLAKVTILFLPVSLMSAYFAIPIVGVGDQYTLTDFWVSFAVVFGLSFIALVGFGQLSGTQEGKPIYKSLTKTYFEISRQLISRKKPETRSGHQ